MSHCDLKSRDTLSRGWTSPIPLLLGELSANTFRQAQQRLAARTCAHTHTHMSTHSEQSCPHSSSSSATHACLERRCCNACFLSQTASFITGRTFHVGLSSWVSSPTAARTLLLYRKCIYIISTGYLGIEALKWVASNPQVCGAG